MTVMDTLVLPPRPRPTHLSLLNISTYIQDFGEVEDSGAFNERHDHVRMSTHSSSDLPIVGSMSNADAKIQ